MSNLVCDVYKVQILILLVLIFFAVVFAVFAFWEYRKAKRVQRGEIKIKQDNSRIMRKLGAINLLMDGIILKANATRSLLDDVSKELVLDEKGEGGDTKH